MENDDMEIARLRAETAKLNAEADKLAAEQRKLLFEAVKLHDEAMKMDRERWWYPVAVAAALMAAGAALMGGIGAFILRLTQHG